MLLEIKTAKGTFLLQVFIWFQLTPLTRLAAVLWYSSEVESVSSSENVPAITSDPTTVADELPAIRISTMLPTISNGNVCFQN